jgi:hypothetical protein
MSEKNSSDAPFLFGWSRGNPKPVPTPAPADSQQSAAVNHNGLAKMISPTATPDSDDET